MLTEGGVKQWLKFKIGDLFHISIGKSIDGNKTNRNGKHAYITRKESDNGLDGFIDDNIELLNELKPVITIGNETAKPFVQTFPFFTGTKVNILQSKQPCTKYALYYIATSLEQHKQKYSYSYTINSSRLKEQVILLPVTAKHEIDYEHMDLFMREIENKIMVNFLKNKQKR